MSVRSLLVVAVLALLSGTGCKAKIGAKCTLSTDCSVQGDRLCDATQPAGYCTIFNCEPGRCPDEAVCVGFHAQADPSPACANPQRWLRLERTFCVRTCDDDCRDGYQCANAAQLLQTYGATIQEADTSARVCVPLPTPREIAKDPATGQASYDTAVCTDAPQPFDIPFYNGSAGMSGASGAGGTAGTGGSGTAGTGGTGGTGGM